MIIFTYKNKILAEISINGLDINEIEETKQLLAYENKTIPNAIETKIIE